ncbi:hypothetical protein [Sulfurimonas marina]|nr:hypothetical protein [Sulfurimonas marina]
MMYLKRYTIASLIWMAIVGWFVYAYVTPETFAVNLFGTQMPALSIALLVVIPVFILYIASTAHMWFHSLVRTFQDRKYQKDYDKIIDAIVDAYVGKANRHYEFRTPRYKLLGMLLENTAIAPLKDIAGITKNEKIDTILEVINKIKAGEVVDLKPYGLKAENELVIANKRNKYKNGGLTAEAILSNSTKYADVLCKEVYVDFVQTAPLEGIEKYKEYMSEEALNIIFARINADENRIEIPNEQLIALMNMLKLDKKNLINISRTLSKSGMIPEQRMKLFETLIESNEDAMDAYLYTLFDLEMLAPADEILDIASADEYLNFRAYRALKECGKNFHIDMFI